ncbi:1-phosphatidylinositol 4-kinase [Entamoeba marina]
MSLHQKYLNCLLKVDSCSHETRLKPLLRNLKTCSAESGLLSRSVIQSLTTIHLFYNSIDTNHPMYNELSELLKKYIIILPSISLQQHHNYLVALFSHSANSLIHNDVMNCLKTILESNNIETIKIIATALTNSTLDGYSTVERKQLLSLFQNYQEDIKFVKILIQLCNSEVTIDTTEIPKNAELFERIEYYTILSQHDSHYLEELERVIQEVLLRDPNTIYNFYSKIFDAVKLLIPFDTRCLDDVRKNCINSCVPVDKLNEIICLLIGSIGDDYMPRFVESTRMHATQLYSTTSSLSKSVNQFNNLLQFISSFCVNIKTQSIVQPLLRHIIGLLNYPPNEKDIAILSSLPVFASLNNTNDCQSILSEFLNLFKRAETDYSNHVTSITKTTTDIVKTLSSVLQLVPELLTQLAQSVTDTTIRFDLLKQIVGRFIQIGNSARPTKELNECAEVNYMGSLLESISLLMVGMESKIEQNESRLFRTFWFYCVSLKFVCKGVWRSDWLSATQIIACNLPPLLIRRSHILLEMESEIESIINHFYSANDQHMLRTMLSNDIEFTNQLRSSTTQRSIYFISVCYMENFRCSYLNFEHLTEYLDDSILDDNTMSVILPLFLFISRSSFNMCKTTIASSKDIKTTKLTQLMSFLLIKLPTSNASLRSFVETSLNDVIQNNPSVLLNKRVLFLALNMYGATSSFVLTDPINISRIKISNTNDYIDVPEDAATATKITEVIKTFLTKYLRDGFELQQFAMSQLIQAYIMSLKVSVEGHKGVELSLEIAKDFVNVSEITWTIYQKADYTGRTAGALDASATVENVKEWLMKQLKTYKGGSTILKQTASFIISNCDNLKECSDLIDQIVDVPLKIFTVECIQSAISMWRWILAVSNKYIGNYLLMSLSSVWKETISKHIGLFNTKFVASNPLSSTIGETKEFFETTVRPHHLIISFLMEQLPVIKVFGDSYRLEILRTIVAISVTSGMTTEASSVGTRFLLLLLGLKIIEVSIQEPRHFIDLVEKIQKCGLDWFETKPEWFESTRKCAEEDIAVLIEFNKTLMTITSAVADKRFQCNEEYIQIVKQRTILLLALVGSEIERIAVWNNPLNRLQRQFTNQRLFLFENIPKEYKRQIKDYISLSWYFSPNLAVGFYQRFPSMTCRSALTKNILAQPSKLINNADAHVFIATPEYVESNIPQLTQLLYWESTDPPHALNLLRKCYKSNPITTMYALRVIDTFTEQTVLYYVPQLVQSLRYDKLGLVEVFLIRMGKKYQLVAHQLIWNCDTYSTQTGENPIKHDEGFVLKLKRICSKIIENYDQSEMQFYESERKFFENFTRISGELIPLPRPDRLKHLKDKLAELKVERNDLYVPTNPNAMVVDVSNKGCACLRSAAKVPILVNMTVQDRFTQQQSPLPVIFKAGDDIRSDMLAVQLIELFDRINKHAGLQLYLCPYHIIATGPDCGIIEVVQNSMSRDQMGEKTDGDMYDYFVAKNEGRKTDSFFKARANFIKSMAAYSIVSYILQIKDRHNGNILIDDDGHIIHIDFGFMFDRTPGGDLKFERSPFKLTEEMISIMGGSPYAEQFIWFMEQGVKSFLAIRQHYPSIITLVDLIFNPDGNCTQSAQFMSKVMAEAFSMKGTFFTYFYDKFQEFDNGISM